MYSETADFEYVCNSKVLMLFWKARQLVQRAIGEQTSID